MKNVKHNLKDKNRFQRRSCGCIVQIVPSEAPSRYLDVLYSKTEISCLKHDEHVRVITYDTALIELYYRKKYL